MSGPVVANPHLVKKGKWIQCNTENYVPIVVPGLSTTSSSTSSSTLTPPTSATPDIEDSIPDPAPIECESEDRQARWTPLHEPDEIPKPNKFMNHEYARVNPLQSDLTFWLQAFRENLVDERLPEHRDSHASSSHWSSLEPQRKKWYRVSTDFESRNCEICQRTQITKAPCRRCTGEAVPRAENFGSLDNRSQSS